MSDRPERVNIADRRQTRREGVHAHARLTLPDGVVVEGAFADLSPYGGRFIASPGFRPLPSSALVRVTFGDLVMTARVIWHRRFHDGTQHVSVLGRFKCQLYLHISEFQSNPNFVYPCASLNFRSSISISICR